MPAEPAPLAAAMARVGDRWTLLVIEALLDGASRFKDLEAAVSGIASNVLSQRLKHLEHEGLVRAVPYSRRPPRHSYELTAAGEDLADALRLLAAWGGEHAGDAAAVAHTLCGTSLEVRWYCPTCDVVVDDPEADDLRYA